MPAAVHAVSTTGIYCRPDCSASPLPVHVSSFVLPAAAEAAGYRACHRCRPYRTSEPMVSVDAPELVCRAVRMVVDGALDDGTEADLGARLGISARHLRRLFDVHVGATPDQLARSRRAHFARRLLDDTDLAVVDVATAAGYGSSRQLTRELQRVFRASPTELRAKRRKADRLVADGGLRVRLAFPPPLDADHLLGFLAARAVPGVEVVDLEAGTYRRTVEVAGDAGVLEVGPFEADTVPVTWHLPHWEGLSHLNGRVRHLFGLDVDPAAIMSALGDDPVVGPLVRAAPGRRVPGAWDFGEVAVRAVVGQQVSVAAATTLMGRIVERFGTPVEGLAPMGLVARFPSAATLAGAGPDAVAGCGLPRARAGAVVALTAALADGTLVLDGSWEAAAVEAALVALPGIGPWTAGYLAMRLGQPDALAHGDLVLRQRLAVALGADEVSPRQLEAAAEAWRPQRAAAAVQLWASP